MRGVDLGQDSFDDLALTSLGENQNLVPDGPRPLVRLPQKRAAALA